MCEFPLDQITPCGIEAVDFHALMGLAGIICATILWKAIYDAFLN